MKAKYSGHACKSCELLKQYNTNQAKFIKHLQEDLKASNNSLAELEELLENNQEPSLPPQTKEGKKYSNNIRVLYYRLLAMEIHPGQIEPCIRAVLDTFCPELASVDLPKQSLARQMRSNELLTINRAQQASILATTTSNVLGSDGTTLNQHKVQCTRLGGLTLGIEKVADGSAKSIVTQLEKTLARIS